MAYTKKRHRKRSRFTPGPDVAKAKTPKAMSPLYVNAALAIVCVARLGNDPDDLNDRPRRLHRRRGFFVLHAIDGS